MTQTKTQTKPYKETLEKVLYSTDYETTSSNGDVYPTNRVKVELVNYSGQVEVKGEIRDYEGQKIIIKNTKLVLNQGQVETKKKIIGNFIKDDETIVKLGVDEFHNLIKEFSKKIDKE